MLYSLGSFCVATASTKHWWIDAKMRYQLKSGASSGTQMQKHAAGDTLSITIAREGQMQTVNVTLGEKTASNS